jgi:hypothetical protein
MDNRRPGGHPHSPAREQAGPLAAVGEDILRTQCAIWITGAPDNETVAATTITPLP